MSPRTRLSAKPEEPAASTTPARHASDRQAQPPSQSGPFIRPPHRRAGTTYYVDNFDISAVNGVSLTLDIQQVGGDATADPGSPQNIFWLTNSRVNPPNYPMSEHGQDMRSNNACPAPFRLKRSDPMSRRNLTAKCYGFVIEGDTGKPVGGDSTVACFSNCGKYKFPIEPKL